MNTSSLPVTVTYSSASNSVDKDRYCNTECILFGTVFESYKENLRQRLHGLCDPEEVPFKEHNMIFKLKISNSDSPVQVQMRRRYNQDGFYWHCRYSGIPEATKQPVTIRKTIDSTLYSTNMMDFLKTLGLRFSILYLNIKYFRMQYEYIASGYLFTKDNIRIVLYKMEYTPVIGNYSKENMQTLSDSWMIEATIMVPDGAPYEKDAKTLREFCEQLAP